MGTKLFLPLIRFCMFVCFWIFCFFVDFFFCKTVKGKYLLNDVFLWKISTLEKKNKDTV